VDYLFGYDATAEVMEDWMYEEVAERYVLDQEMQRFLRQSNPWALRAMLDRLLEAIQRQMWAADDEMIQRLHAAYLMADGDLEDRLDRAWAGYWEEEAVRLETVEDATEESEVLEETDEG
jgi:cobaltochelatase CobN